MNDNKIITKFYTSFFEDDVINHSFELDQVVDGIMEESSNMFSEYDIIKGVLNYYLEKNINFSEIFDTSDMFYYYRDDLAPILNEIGYHDKFNIFEVCGYFDISFEPVDSHGGYTSRSNIFLSVDNFHEFSVLFEESEQYIIENVVGEDWFELYDMNYIKIDDIIDDINIESLNHIKEYIISNYLGLELDDGGVLTIELLNDEDTLKDMIINEELLYDLKIDLENLYGDAYNITAESELFDSFNNQLKDFFDVSEIKYNNKNEIEVNVTSLYKEYSKEYLDMFLYLPCSDHNSFLDVLTEVLNEDNNKLSLGINLDYYYPDQNKLEINFNDIILNNLMV